MLDVTLRHSADIQQNQKINRSEFMVENRLSADFGSEPERGETLYTQELLSPDRYIVPESIRAAVCSR